MTTLTVSKSSPVQTPSQITDQKPRNPNLRPPWKKGDPSPNPSGRPKKLPITDRILHRLEEKLPDDIRILTGLKPGATWGDALVERQLREGVAGSTQAFNALGDRAEGKPRQPIDVKADDIEELAEVLSRARRRVEAAKEKRKK